MLPQRPESVSPAIDLAHTGRRWTHDGTVGRRGRLGRARIGERATAVAARDAARAGGRVTFIARPDPDHPDGLHIETVR
jgi:hypothetical protein